MASPDGDDFAGKLTISGPGGTFELDLTSSADEPGELGGHQEWSKSGSFELSEGTYTLSITHQNIDMPHNEYNQSVCAGTRDSDRAGTPAAVHSSDTSFLLSSSSSDAAGGKGNLLLPLRCMHGRAEGNEYTIAAENCG